MKKDEYVGVPWPVASKRISRAWKQLDAESKAKYQQMAKQEINEQHEAMVEHGLRKEADGVSAEEHDGNGGVTPCDAQTVQFGRYVLLQQGELGRGTYGRVMVAKEIKSERRVAPKILEDEAEAKREISMYTYMSSIGGHRNILPLLEHGANPPTPFLSLPYVPGLNVRDALKKGSLSASERMGMASQLAEGMTWLHTCHIAHLDLKPGNLLWESRCCHLMLIDFGMALKWQKDGTPADDFEPFTAVTPNYRPPELWKTKMSKAMTCWPVDVWSFGVTMVEIFASTMLLPGKTKEHIWSALQQWVRAWNTKTGHPSLVAIPKHLRNVAWYCCAPEARVRPKMKQDIIGWAYSLPPCPMKC